MSIYKLDVELTLHACFIFLLSAFNCHYCLCFIATRDNRKDKLVVRKKGKEKLKEKYFKVSVMIGVENSDVDSQSLVTKEEAYFGVLYC